MSNREDVGEVGESALGTKEYWDAAYEKDLENYLENFDDSGEIWFGRACQDRMIKWLRNRSDIDPETSGILDLGCGNGAMTLALRKAGYKRVVGMDYSEGAIKLARSVAEKGNIEDVNFQVCDILSDTSIADTKLDNRFDVLFDKGTFDAIGLMADKEASRRLYKKNACRFFASSSPHRLLVLASCNSTKEELLDFFGPEFAFLDDIPNPNRYVFGGQAGTTVTTVVLRLLPQT